MLGDPATVAHKFDVLKQHCEAVGRDYTKIRRSAVPACSIAETDEQAQAVFQSRPQPIFPGDVLSHGLIGTPDTIRKRAAAVVMRSRMYAAQLDLSNSALLATATPASIWRRTTSLTASRRTLVLRAVPLLMVRSSVQVCACWPNE